MTPLPYLDGREALQVLLGKGFQPFIRGEEDLRPDDVPVLIQPIKRDAGYGLDPFAGLPSDVIGSWWPYLVITRLIREGERKRARGGAK